MSSTLSVRCHSPAASEERSVMCRLPSDTARALLLVLASFLAGCAGPRSLPSGPTPIPTLIPATEPSGPQGTTPTASFAILSYPAQLPSAGLGRPLYAANCATCHGAGGTGVVPGARNFNDLDYMRGETPAFFYTA